jgi:hypothetical protein
MSETTKQEAVQRRAISIARKIVAVQRSLSAFDYGDDQYLSKSVNQAIHECERAFADKDYALAEHPTKVIVYLVKREAPKFAADKKKKIARWKELHASHIHGAPAKSSVAMKRVQHVDEEN